MRPSEVFMAARDAVMEMAKIDEKIFELSEHIGVMGHSYDRKAKNDIKDPSRKVIEMLDGTMELEREKRECQRSVDEAMRLIIGLNAIDELAAYVVMEHYVRLRHDWQIARGIGTNEAVAKKFRKTILKECDKIGYTKLRMGAFDGYNL